MTASTTTTAVTFAVYDLVSKALLGNITHTPAPTGTRAERRAALSADLVLAKKLTALIPAGARLTHIGSERNSPKLWVSWTITQDAHTPKPAPAVKASVKAKAPKTTRGLSTPDKRLVTQTSNRLHITPQAARTLLGI